MLARSLMIAALLGTTAMGREVVDRVIAVVDKDIILESDVSMALEELSQRPEYAKYGAIEMRKKVLDKMVEDKILLAKARLDTLDASEAEVKERVNDQVRQIMASQRTNEAGLAQMVKAQMGLSLEDFKTKFLAKQFREQMAQQRLRQRYVGMSPLSNVEVDEFYKKYADSLPTEKNVWKISRIEFKINPSPSLVDSVYKLAQSVLKMAQDGQNFERLVSQYSMDSSSRVDGGDLGFYKKGALDPHYEAAAFQKENGQLVDRPVLSKLGYHIIKILDKRDNEIRTAQIFFPLAPTASDTLRTKELALKVRDSVLAGADFGAMALNYSDDKLSAVKSGSLGWLPADQLDQGYLSEIQNLQVGQLSQPIAIGEHWHLLKMEGHEDEHKLRLPEDRERLSQLASQFMANQKMQELIGEWRRQIHIEMR